MYRHCSASPRCGTCLRFSAAGAARSRSPLSPRHPPSLCSVGSRSRVPSSFHPHALRHLTTRSARVRSRSQPLFSIVPGLSSEHFSQPLGGCRCALPACCLNCADRRTERQARLAFSRSAGLAHRLSQQSADHVSLHACPARHCSAPWSLCAQAFCRTESFCRPSSQRSSLFSPRHLPPFPAAGAAPVRHHRSISLRCGTCLRFALAGAARSRLPLSGQSVIGTFPHPRSAAAAVRCAGKATVPCSFLRSAALTLRSILLIPTSCLSAQGITARLAAYPRSLAVCADRRTERHARLAFSRSAGLVTA